MKGGDVYDGSDGSFKDGIGGHLYWITGNTFTLFIWDHAHIARQSTDMTSLRSEHGEGIGIIHILYAMQIFYVPFTLSDQITVFIDNADGIRRGK